MYGLVQNNHERYTRFVSSIVRSAKVYGIKSNDGLIIKKSMGSFYDVSGENLSFKTIPFWSKQNLAADEAINTFGKTEVVEIPLNDFLENQCIELHLNNYLITTEANSRGVGMEIQPLDLVFDILEEMKTQGKTLFANDNNSQAFNSYKKKSIS